MAFPTNYYIQYILDVSWIFCLFQEYNKPVLLVEMILQVAV